MTKGSLILRFGGKQVLSLSAYLTQTHTGSHTHTNTLIIRKCYVSFTHTYTPAQTMSPIKFPSEMIRKVWLVFFFVVCLSFASSLATMLPILAAVLPSHHKFTLSQEEVRIDEANTCERTPAACLPLSLPSRPPTRFRQRCQCFIRAEMPHETCFRMLT